MSEVVQLLAEAAIVGAEAVVISSKRPIHVLVEGSLRPLQASALDTEQIVAMLGQVAGPEERALLQADGAFTFQYAPDGKPGAAIAVERHGDFVFARLELKDSKGAAPSEPPAPTVEEPLSEDLDFFTFTEEADRGPERAPEPPAPGPFDAGPELDLASDSEGELELDLDRAGVFAPRSSAALPPELDTTAGPEPEPEEIEPMEATGQIVRRAPGVAIPAPQQLAVEEAPELGPRVLPPLLMNLLRFLIEQRGSDLHLSPGSPPRVRLAGQLAPFGDRALTAEENESFFRAVLDRTQHRKFREELALDFSLELPELGRFRANTYNQRKGYNLVFRAVPRKVPTLAELGLPAVVDKLTQFPNGLVLVTGPAGCGKSTSQAAIIDRINETWRDHIITVEDPIEFVHQPKGCLVNQREVGTHVRTFAEALRSALREDPDVILVGELRDLETIQLAVTAAETGHLVLGTLHTIDAARTVDRLIDVFPGEQKLQIRSMVSESLRGVISQRLLPGIDGKSRVAAFEILLTDRSVSNLIREGKTFQIPNVTVHRYAGSRLGGGVRVSLAA